MCTRCTAATKSTGRRDLTRLVSVWSREGTQTLPPVLCQSIHHTPSPPVTRAVINHLFRLLPLHPVQLPRHRFGGGSGNTLRPQLSQVVNAPRDQQPRVAVAAAPIHSAAPATLQEPADLKDAALVYSPPGVFGRLRSLDATVPPPASRHGPRLREILREFFPHERLHGVIARRAPAPHPHPRRFAVRVAPIALAAAAAAVPFLSRAAAGTGAVEDGRVSVGHAHADHAAAVVVNRQARAVLVDDVRESQRQACLCSSKEGGDGTEGRA